MKEKERFEEKKSTILYFTFYRQSQDGATILEEEEEQEEEEQEEYSAVREGTDISEKYIVLRATTHINVFIKDTYHACI